MTVRGTDSELLPGLGSVLSPHTDVWNSPNSDSRQASLCHLHFTDEISESEEVSYLGVSLHRQDAEPG